MRSIAPIVAAGLLLAVNPAVAGPADKIYSPTVEKGEVELEFKAGQARPGDGGVRTTESIIALGYGFTDWWFAEVEFNYKRVEPEKSRYDASALENVFQLTETGRYPVDIGLLLEIERPQDRTEGYEVKWGPLLQTEFGKWQLNGNLLFECNHRNLEPGPTKLLHQAQIKYRWRKELEFGIQSFGEVGQWNAWLPRPSREHSIGPAIFGKIGLGSHHAFKYNLAVLTGNSPATADRTLRLQTEFEF